eukprot:5179480-Prymnesium_polylepis.1
MRNLEVTASADRKGSASAPQGERALPLALRARSDEGVLPCISCGSARCDTDHSRPPASSRVEAMRTAPEAASYNRAPHGSRVT